MESQKFIKALKAADLQSLRRVPKADLHNHFVLGGNRDYIYDKTGIDIQPLKAPLHSMSEMHEWVSSNTGRVFSSAEMRKFKIDATFYQAVYDGVKILEIGEDVWGLKEYFNNDIESLIKAFLEAQSRIAPEVELRLQIGLSRHCGIAYLERVIEPFLGQKAFYSLDLYGDEMAQPISAFKNLYQRVKREGIKVKAHVGEWGSARDVVEAVECLELDEIQHGIAIASDAYAIDFIKERGIRLNITPSSNVLLGRVDSMKNHPIQKLFRAGVDVTINSDDILIFDSDVSKEYLRLYQAGVLEAEELDQIRLNGLKPL